ncbi:MAG: hypothetical protein WHT08_09970 [Bryobacteraceae bacterium]|jgi:hypothetical protein
MVVKLRWKRSQPRKRRAPAPPPPPLTQQEIEGGLAAILSPLAAVCFALSVWRLGQDLGFTGNFFIQDGPLAHWQPWFALSATFALASSRLNRRSQSGGGNTPATN